MTMTRNAASVTDEDSFTVRRTIEIAASIDKVWRAVTEPEHISRWFGRADFADRAVGASGTLTWEGRSPIPLRIEALEEPHTVSYRWSNDDALGTSPAELDEAHSTVFTFTLEPVPDGTRLTVVETGFERTSAPLANLEDHRKGWDGELDKLVALLEGSA
ncbi:SRPBCC domain-containing protein [Naasia aerilata]|uniref:Activator of HSP90 ATPase n=1 Tax=Naasia aerilata TaxID=1162966 RepID=A0ABM8GEY3_9MICO|nr:SRPBCC domain-containing protein [Naasia aerilata]BDZ46910.1 activator of HSP90 ATPase [Naasia aerilata]